jgi:hypothetical protein
MKKSFVSLGSGWLTSWLLIVLVAVILIEIKIQRAASVRWSAGEKAWLGAEMASALAHAVEQYCVDFPDTGRLGNTRELKQWLAGQNPKDIRYLKVEKYSPDASGRLLDPCGSPWVIEVSGDPGFESVENPASGDEFHVTSNSCPGFAIGHRHNPRYDPSGR